MRTRTGWRVTFVALVVFALALQVITVIQNRRAVALYHGTTAVVDGLAVPGPGAPSNAADRISDAQLRSALARSRAASRIRPDSATMRQRMLVLVAATYERADRLAAARATLIDALTLSSPPDQQVRSHLARVNQAIMAQSTWKAHVLHQREKPGGVLYPEDLLP